MGVVLHPDDSGPPEGQFLTPTGGEQLLVLVPEMVAGAVAQRRAVWEELFDMCRRVKVFTSATYSSRGYRWFFSTDTWRTAVRVISRSFTPIKHECLFLMLRVKPLPTV